MLYLGNLHKFLSLPPGRRGLFAQALAGLALTAAALRLVSLKRLATVLLRLAPSLPVSTSDESKAAARIRMTSEMVSLAAKHCPVTANCLTQSLVLWWLLRRAGFASELRLGARRGAGRFEAHAWVEVQGHPINDRADVRQRFSSFDQEILERVAW